MQLSRRTSGSRLPTEPAATSRAWGRTGSTDAGVVEGIGRTGRLVTGAALIMFFAFAALSQDRKRTSR